MVVGGQRSQWVAGVDVAVMTAAAAAAAACGSSNRGGTPRRWRRRQGSATLPDIPPLLIPESNPLRLDQDDPEPLSLSKLFLKKRRLFHRKLVLGLYRLYIGVADGMSNARVWTCRYSK